MIRRPPRSTRTEHTLSLHDALPISFADHDAVHEQRFAADARVEDALADQGQRRLGWQARQAEVLQARGHGGHVAFDDRVGQAFLVAERAVERGHRAAGLPDDLAEGGAPRSEEHTSELQSLMRISYAVFCLQKKTKNTTKTSIR